MASLANSTLTGGRLAWARGRLNAWRWLVFPVFVFASSRAGILAVSSWSVRMDPHFHRTLPPSDFPSFEHLCDWDCEWFTRLAAHGYSEPVDSNFFPLYPILGRWFHALTGLPVVWSLVAIANLAALAALVVIYRLFHELEGEQVAQTALVLWVAWPFTFFQATGYPESLMVLSTATAIVLARRGRHLWAGTALGLGVLARHLTLVGGPSLVIAQVRQRGIRPRQLIFNWNILGLLLPFLWGGLYLGFLWMRFGNPLVFWYARSQGWGQGAWYGLPAFFTRGPFDLRIWVYVGLSIVPGIGSVLLFRKRAWLELAGFAATLMAAVWSMGLLGLGRYTGSAWPAFLPFAIWLSKRPGFSTMVGAAFALLQGLFVYLFTHSYPIN